MSETIRVIDSAIGCPEIPIVRGGGNARVVVWPETGAMHRSMHLVTLDGGAETVPLRHPHDAAYYIIAGSGRVADLASGTSQSIGEGSMVHIDAGDRYGFAADTDGMTLIGGPCPADAALYSTLSAG